MRREAPGLRRVKQDMREARLWKARDRLTGMLVMYPTHPKVLDLLGEVYFQMADLPNAGRFWLLTERTGPEVEAAFAAMQERYSSNAALARAIPIRAPLGMYPQIVQERLAGELFPMLHRTAHEEMPMGVTAERYVMLGRKKDPLAPTKLSEFSSTLGGLVAAVALLGGWLAGVVWVSKETDGVVWLIFAPLVLVAVLVAWIDSRLKRRRLRALQQDVKSKQDAA